MTSTRPNIEDCPDSSVFRQWYYLKSELQSFARDHGLRTTGGKFEIADRIAYFLDHGKAPPQPKRKAPVSKFDWHNEPLSLQTPITDSYRNTQNVRRFMTSHIPNFSFSIPLMDWMKANVGKTLAEAVDEAKRLKEAKRRGVKQPNQPHNQFNAYTRAYFAAVPAGSQSEVRALWEEKRKRPGPYVFDLSDLDFLS